MSSALIVIDLQKDLCYNHKRHIKVRGMIPSLLKAIDIFASRNLPIYYVYFALQPDDEQFARFGDVYCIEGTEGAEFIPEILPLRGQAIKKRKHSAFFETELDDLLRSQKVSTIYLTGLQTQICIMTTAADANFRGYTTKVIEECVVSTQDISKQQALDWIAKYVGEVIHLPQLEKDLFYEG
jgi:nicotinamidase-related amidase